MSPPGLASATFDPSAPTHRNKDSSITEEVDRVTSAIARCNESVKLKKDMLAKNERSIRDMEYEVGSRDGAGGLPV